MPQSEVDYVIVGAGSAGCVLANRLTEGGAGSVLLLEAGGWGLSPYLQVPAGMLKLDPEKYYWHYDIEPDPSRHDRTDHWAPGRVVGGGSAVNAMLWVRGNRADYDHWASVGAEGWDYESVLPYLRAAETWQRGATPFRGGSGPQRVSVIGMEHPVVKRWLAGADEIGLRTLEDYNGEDQLGAGWSQVSQWRGLRHSTASAFLLPALRRKQLKVKVNATVRRVLFEGDRAVGVEYETGGETTRVRARREVIVSAGAIESPALLLRSGVGDPEALRALGIEVVAEVPGVGRNLQEHPTVSLVFEVSEKTLNQQLNPGDMARAGLEFALRGRGPATSPLTHAMGFERLHDDQAWPTFQAMVSPMATAFEPPADEASDPEDYVQSKQDVQLATGSVVTSFISLLHPKSRGSVTLRSADPTHAPAIEFPFVADPGDVADLIAACRRVRDLYGSAAMRPVVLREKSPGPEVQTDEQWEHFIRAFSFGAAHWVGTAKMGSPDDPEAVVDPRLRVRGVQGLRVVDASVMPTLTSGNTNAPTVLIAEKGAAMIATGMP